MNLRNRANCNTSITNANERYFFLSTVVLLCAWVLFGCKLVEPIRQSAIFSNAGQTICSSYIAEIKVFFFDDLSSLFRTNIVVENLWGNCTTMRESKFQRHRIISIYACK